MNDTPYSILVVENDPHQANLLEVVCSRADPKPHVHVVRSAEEAISYLDPPEPDADVASLLPDIILLDVFMEGIGGLGFLEWYSQQPTFQHIHVVVFTSSEDADLARQCLSLGARECVVKSWNFTEVLPVLFKNLVDR